MPIVFIRYGSQLCGFGSGQRYGGGTGAGGRSGKGFQNARYGWEVTADNALIFHRAAASIRACDKPVRTVHLKSDPVVLLYQLILEILIFIEEKSDFIWSGRNCTMRRSDREINNFAEIVDVIKKCDVCRVAWNDNGYPYITNPHNCEP